MGDVDIEEVWSDRLELRDQKDCKKLIKIIMSKLHDTKMILIVKFIDKISKNFDEIMNGKNKMILNIVKTPNKNIDITEISFLELSDIVSGFINIKIGESISIDYECISIEEFCNLILKNFPPKEQDGKYYMAYGAITDKTDKYCIQISRKEIL